MANNKFSLKIYFIIFWVLIAGLVAPLRVFAQDSVRGLMEKVVEVFKNGKKPAAILDLISWENAYNRLLPGQKKELGVKSAEDLKNYYKKMAQAEARPGSKNHAQYKVGNINTVAKNTAMVELYITEGKATKKSVIEAVKVSGKWYLSGPDFVKSETLLDNGPVKFEGHKVLNSLPQR